MVLPSAGFCVFAKVSEEVIGLNRLNQKSVVNYQISDLSRKLQEFINKKNLKIDLK